MTLKRSVRMFVKLATITLVAFIATAHGEQLWNNLIAKWSLGDDDAWYSMPRNLSSAQSDGWNQLPNASDFDDVIGMARYDDPRVTLMYNTTTDEITGLQFCIPVADMEKENNTLNYTSLPHFIAKTINNVEYYTSSIYFSEDAEADTRVIHSLRSDGTLENIPTKAEELLSETTYEQKVCIPKMGRHFYKMNRSTTPDEWSPWALITDDGENIISVVFTGVGVMSEINNRNWTENFDVSTLTYYIPSTPQWLVDLLGEFGFISFHLFFIDPRDFVCSSLE